MRSHTKIYMDHFGYDVSDFIPCENCGARAVDIAHIIPRSKFGSKRIEQRDDIHNLMALCRKCHYDYDFNNKMTREYMTEKHNKVMTSTIDR